MIIALLRSFLPLTRLFDTNYIYSEYRIVAELYDLGVQFIKVRKLLLFLWFAGQKLDGRKILLDAWTRRGAYLLQTIFSGPATKAR